jgi:tetratricopeptide (TPR) repeat protein
MRRPTGRGPAHDPAPWGEDPPPSARSTLYGYIARLRAILASAADGEATLSRQRAGYLLQAEPDQLDLHRSQLTQAADDFGQALAVCHRIDYPAGAGAALNKLGDVSLRQGEYQPAVRYSRQALALYQKIGDDYSGQILTLCSLAEALQVAGEPVAARAG